jgi:hypothetical protein
MIPLILNDNSSRISNIPEVSQTSTMKYADPIHGDVEVQTWVISLPPKLNL